MVERATAAANLGIKAHAHMLRHACGYKLANDGHDTRRCRPTSAIVISRTLLGIQRSHLIGSRAFGRIRESCRCS
jgi:hypothetical protein